MMYVELSPLLQDLVLLLTLIESYFSIYVFFRCVILRVRAPYFPRIAATVALSISLFLFLGSSLTKAKAHMPLLVILLFLILFFWNCVRGQLFLRRWKERHITPMSIKEGFDSLPAGLCYYWAKGPVKAANRKIEELCLELTGRELSDGEAFYHAILAANMAGENGSDHPIFSAPDGTVYSVRRNSVLLDGSELVEIIASDISEEYTLNLKLQETERQVRYRNARLKALSETIRIMAMEQEALNTKVRIHDRLGHLLLMTKRYLTNPDEMDVTDILEEWRLNAVLLTNRKIELWQEPYFITRGQAEALGVELAIDGELPVDAHLRHLIETAINVHVTNVLRHAGGHVAKIEVVANEASYIMTFTNDGKPPKKPITESGGLLNLRREVEAVGGQMLLRGNPRFILILLLPKERRGI